MLLSCHNLVDSRFFLICARADFVAFKTLKDILMGGRLPKAFQNRLKEAEAVARWEAAVGPIISKHAHALRVEDGVLHVEVGHPIWRSELHHRRRQILEILNQGAKDASAILKDLHFSDPRTPGQGTRKNASAAAANMTKNTTRTG